MSSRREGGMAESPKSPSPSPSSVGLSVGPSVGAARTIPQRAFLISTLAEKEGRKERKRKRKRKSERDSGRRQCVSVGAVILPRIFHGFAIAILLSFGGPRDTRPAASVRQTVIRKEGIAFVLHKPAHRWDVLRARICVYDPMPPIRRISRTN